MPINAHPEYIAAEKEYLVAQSLDEKIEKLRKMISVAPSHKGAENLRAQLKTRLKKLTEQLEKSKKKGATKKGIKKEAMQAVLVGFTNSGKSAILKSLTNANPKISEVEFATKTPLVGMLNYRGVQIQVIENPAIESEYYDKGLTNSADTVLLLINSQNEIEKILAQIKNNSSKKIVVFSKIDLFEQDKKRKISSFLQSKKYNFVLTSVFTNEGLEELKEKIFESFNNLRIYTKEPTKNKSDKPIIMPPGSTVKDVAEKILKGFSSKVKETKIWGPSSKFSGQIVGLKHKLKDLDVVEFKTR